MTLMAQDRSTVARECTESWLAALDTALQRCDIDSAAALFVADGYWRDVLAFTWGLHTYCGVDQIRSAMKMSVPSAGIFGLRLDETVAPRYVRRAGVTAIESFFTFETTVGHGRGVVRLHEPSDGGRPRAWTLLTSLQEFREQGGSAAAVVDRHSTRFGGPNWWDQRQEKLRFADTEPAVLVVGGGQAGLAIAARLGQLDVDTLVIDREERIGDNWRHRYHSLILHNEVWVNHLPFMPFPDTWPTYVPKDKLAGWFEAYVESMEINFWTGTEFVGGQYEPEHGRWRVTLRRADGSERTVRPRHIVMATGVSGIPHLPTIPGLERFSGAVLHSSAFADGSAFAGKEVFVIGSGNSGHDVAQEMYARGARVTLVQRSATAVASVGPDAAGRVYSLYSEGPSTEDCDLLNISIPYPVLRRSYQLVTRDLYELDKDLIEGLESVGFRVDYGEDATGFQMKYLRRGGGYYLNVGCSDLIVEKKIKLLQFSEIGHFNAAGAVLEDGRQVSVDAVVLATGYQHQQELVRRLLGDDVADRVGPVWGFDDEGELRNMWKRTAQEGLWFIAGSLAQCRIFSKFLALQIKACQDGLIARSADGSVPRGALRSQDLEDVEMDIGAV